MPSRISGRILALLGAWAAMLAVTVMLATIPAVRKPWIATVPANDTSFGVLLSEPIERFFTPYISFAAIQQVPSSGLNVDALRIVLISGAEPVATVDALNARAIASFREPGTRPGNGPEVEWRWRPAVQFAPRETIRVAVVGRGARFHASPITIGYDGQSGAVRIIRYWWPWLAAASLAGLAFLLYPSTQATVVRAATGLTTSAHRPLLLLLLAAAALRLVLAFRGGQYFDGDELRYGRGAVRAFDLLSAGYVGAAVDTILQSGDHAGFRIVGLVPASFHQASAWMAGAPMSELRYPAGEWLPAFVLALASVCCIALVYLLAIRSGASRQEAFLAALLMFLSQSMVLYARGFFPYDVSLSMLLAALWLGLAPGHHRARSFWIGALAGAAVFTYQGYWLLAAVVGCVYVFGSWRPASVLARGVSLAAGAGAVIAAFALAARVRHIRFFEDMYDFSRRVTHGDFSEGWTVPWESLLAIDGVILVANVAGIALAAYFYLRRSDDAAGRSLRWLIPVALIYLGLGIGSNVLHRFVVYDRLSRQMVPFLCLAGAGGWMSLLGGRDRGIARVVLCAMLSVASVPNAWPWMVQQFPRDVIADVVAKYGKSNIRLDSTFAESVADLIPILTPYERESKAGPERYVLLNAKDIWMQPNDPALSYPPEGRAVLTVRHPRQLRSMQYHGYVPRERTFLRAVDFPIQLIDTSGDVDK